MTSFFASSCSWDRPGARGHTDVDSRLEHEMRDLYRRRIDSRHARRNSCAEDGALEVLIQQHHGMRALQLNSLVFSACTELGEPSKVIPLSRGREDDNLVSTAPNFEKVSIVLFLLTDRSRSLCSTRL